MYYSGRLDAAAIDWCLALEYVLHHKVTCIARPRRATLHHAAQFQTAPRHAASSENEVGANGTTSDDKSIE